MSEQKNQTASIRYVPADHKWLRAFNRLEKALTRHMDAKQGTGFTDDADDALHRAHRQVMKDVGPL